MKSPQLGNSYLIKFTIITDWLSAENGNVGTQATSLKLCSRTSRASCALKARAVTTITLAKANPLYNTQISQYFARERHPAIHWNLRELTLSMDWIHFKNQYLEKPLPTGLPSGPSHRPVGNSLTAVGWALKVETKSFPKAMRNLRYKNLAWKSKQNYLYAQRQQQTYFLIDSCCQCKQERRLFGSWLYLTIAEYAPLW